MNRSINLLCIDSVGRQSLERVQHNAFDSGRVCDRDALQAGAEDGFLEIVLITTAVSQRAANLGVDQSLAQRRRRISKQDL